MRPTHDPEGAEISHLLAACELAGKAVLEVGCGDGKLTTQIADLPRKIVGIDPEISDLQIANRERLLSAPHISFIQTIGESLPLPPQSFDVAIFACSL